MSETLNRISAMIPNRLADRIEAQYGAENARRIYAGYAAARPVTLRANTLKTDRDALARRLDGAGIAWSPAPAPALSEAFVIREVRESAIRALPSYDAGELYLQSLSAIRREHSRYGGGAGRQNMPSGSTVGRSRADHGL